MGHIERTRAVIEAGEVHDGRIIPTEQAELGRPVRLDDDSTVQGSVYGETVELSSDATIEGSVMASEAIELEGGNVHGEVGTPGRVTGIGARVDGTVTGTRIRLTDCVVRGNVVGTEVILEDCLVLGITTADRSLSIEGSLCYTFRSLGAATLDDATIVLPQGIVEGNLTLESPVEVAGLGRLEVDGESRRPQMTESDCHVRDGTTYLTLAHRILNLEQVTGRLEELETGIMAAVDDTLDEDEREPIDHVVDLLDDDGNGGTDTD
jgi:cytoskeletal protein CcmA (bactofilin family)